MLNYEELEKELKGEGYSEEYIKKTIDELQKDEIENMKEEHQKLLDQYSITCLKCGGKAEPWIDTNAPEEVQPMIYGHQCKKCGWFE